MFAQCWCHHRVMLTGGLERIALVRFSTAGVVGTVAFFMGAAFVVDAFFEVTDFLPARGVVVLGTDVGVTGLFLGVVVLEGDGWRPDPRARAIARSLASCAENDLRAPDARRTDISMEFLVVWPDPLANDRGIYTLLVIKLPLYN